MITTSHIEQAKGHTSNLIHKVPQGSVIGPILFILYINNITQNVSNVNFHFYADDSHLHLSFHTQAGSYTAPRCF